MNIRIKDNGVEIEGYVNAIERNSKPLTSRIGKFLERICKGAFTRAIERNNDIRLLENHDRLRDLGGTADGTLELAEDAIGLHARAWITDPVAVEKARNGEYVGWSFGFYDVPDGVERGIDEETNLPVRKLRDMELKEVSILDNRREPAYEGTLVAVRSEDEIIYYAEPVISEIEIRQDVPDQAEPVEINYSIWEEMIEEMREESNVEVSGRKAE